MTIQISGSNITSTEELGTAAQTVLQLIPLGSEWFESNLVDQKSTLNFASENQLLETISQGLYESQLVRIPPLDVSIGTNKLLSFNENSLRDLFCFQRQCALGNRSEQIQNEINSILDGNQIISNQKLIQAFDTFQALTAKSAIVIPSLSLMELILTSNISNSLDLKSLKKSLLNQFSSEALNFSQSSVGYIQLVATQVNLYNDAKEGQDFISLTSLLKQLVPALDRYLACPKVSHAPSQAELDKVINLAKTNNQYIGFNDLPSALYQFTKSNELDPNSPTAWLNQFEQYFEKSQACLLMSSASHAELQQDGLHWQYSFSNSIGKALLTYRPDGNICLSEFSVES